MSMKFKLEGFEQLEKNLRLLPKEVGTKAGQLATTKAAQHAARALRAAAPRGEGNGDRTYKSAAGTQKTNYGKLNRNIRVQKRRKKGPNTVGSMIGTTKAFWGFFQEFGTRKMAAKPWWRPTMMSVMPELQNIMASTLRKALFDAAQKRSRK